MTDAQLKRRNRKIKAGVQKRLRMKTELRKEIMENIEGQVEERIQRARDEADTAGYERGARDATRSMQENAMSDLHLAWNQVQQAHQAAANYAGIVSSMYKGRIRNKERETE